METCVVIVDHEHIPAWEAKILKDLSINFEITILSCCNTHFRRKFFRNFLYYFVNLMFMRGPAAKRVSVNEVFVSNRAPILFESGYDGAWQVLPPDILNKISKLSPKFILKFGMGLLRVPSKIDFDIPILSFHHGDPEKFRGRPAGYYEIMRDEPVMGQIVQVIGNNLDQGLVLAFGETKVSSHSYKATLSDSFDVSPFLVPEALRNINNGTFVTRVPRGKNYRLPGNQSVVLFLAKILWNFVLRFVYGAFWEKGWLVATAPATEGFIHDFPQRPAWTSFSPPAGYAFLADPFPLQNGKILVEALKSSTGMGEIWAIDPNGEGGPHYSRLLAVEGKHFSYPALVRDAGEYLVPEVAGWSELLGYPFENGRVGEPVKLHVEGTPRVIDPTFLHHEGHIYMFGNRAGLPPNVLDLWVASSLKEEFRLHPCSPVHISPVGGRMAGAIWRDGDKLFRFGQDGARGYGGGVVAFEINILSPFQYVESPAGTLRFEGVGGPHTLNIVNGVLYFDYFSEKFSLLAGYRRLLARLACKRANKTGC